MTRARIASPTSQLAALVAVLLAVACAASPSVTAAQGHGFARICLLAEPADTAVAAHARDASRADRLPSPQRAAEPGDHARLALRAGMLLRHTALPPPARC
ncbi:MAG: hypothetical protein U0625_09545 [Phycisphaerales bacterium]